MSYALPGYGGEAAETPLFVGRQPRTRSEFWNSVAALRRGLQERHVGQRSMLVATADRYTLSCCVVALWLEGRIALLPPNLSGGALAQVHAAADGPLWIGDSELLGTFAEGGITHGQLEAPLRSPAHSSPGAVLPSSQTIAVTHTSGSTGSFVGHPKTAGQLLGEASMLAKQFQLGKDTTVLSTVPAYHIYGLLFSVLLPLAVGARIIGDTPLHPEAVHQCAFLHEVDTLVSVPAHLSSLEVLGKAPLPKLRRIFSSGAPLPVSTHEALQRQLSIAPTSVLGSTETGGFAFRQDAEGPWTPLPGVTVSEAEDGNLLVDSPFLHPKAPRPYRGGDRISLLAGGTFLHRGRSDGVVKIGGKRVSLPHLEAVLKTTPGVVDAAVLAVAVPSHRGTELRAIVAGTSLDTGKLRSALLEHFDPVVVPRRIRVVDELPRETTGKISKQRLLAVFQSAPDSSKD